MWSLELNTTTCPDGFALVDRQITDDERERLVKRLGLLGDAGLGRYFEPVSDRRAPVRITLDDLSAPVSVDLINANTDEKLCAFFGKYGSIGDNCEAVAFDTAEALRYQFEMVLRHKDVAEVNRLLARRKGVVVPQLAGDPIRLRLVSGDLVGHMVMEASAVTECGADLLACDQCELRFLVGSYTNRRSTARFCSDNCRGRALRERRAGQ